MFLNESKFGWGRKMDNKKIGVALLVFSVILLIIFIFVIRSLQAEAEQLGCFADKGCIRIENSLSVVHFAFGVFGFLFALAFYLLFFSAGEEAIVKRLETDTNRKLTESKFEIFLKGLDKDERTVVQAVRDQPGITQTTLRLRTNLSKSKLSLVVTDLEKRGILRRERKDKTFTICLADEW